MMMLVASILLLLSALYLDLRYQRIPNKLCLFALLLALLLQSISHQWHGIIQAFLGAGLALLILLPAYYFRCLGAGDVKLMIAVGALSGPLLLMWSLVFGVIFGTFTSFVLALYKVGWSGVMNMITHSFIKTKNKSIQKSPPLLVPYAPALALGWLMACYLDPNVVMIVNNFNLPLNY